MTFEEKIKLSTSDIIALAEVDIYSLNTEWVNIGAGIWYRNFNLNYIYVNDNEFLNGFTSKAVTKVGSMYRDSSLLAEVTSLSALTNSTDCFYYDYSTKSLYICLVNYDEPSLYEMRIGIVYGYSTKGFVPVNSTYPYEGRVLSFPTMTHSRDPLFFGKMSYPEGSLELNNADGEFDSFADDEDIYGNMVRLYFGFTDTDINDYELIYTGMIGSVSITEEKMILTISDKRKEMEAEVNVVCTAVNALTEIASLINTAYGQAYSSTYYDTTAWASASSAVDVISANMDAEDTDSISNIIEIICTSVFGFFDITNEGKYTFRIVNNSSTSVTTINRYDFMDPIVINYDPTEVVSSVSIGYDVDLRSSASTSITYIVNDDYEEDTYLKYRIKKRQTFDTWLDSLADAMALSETILSYTKYVHGTIENKLPMKYYNVKIGDSIDAEIYRLQTVSMLGTKKCEVVSIGIDLNNFNIPIKLRII